MEKRFYKNQRFSSVSSLSGTLVRFSIKIDGFGFDFQKSLCLVLLRPAESSLIPWFYRNGFIKGVTGFGSYRHTWVAKKSCHGQTLKNECSISDYPSNSEGL